MFAVKGWSVDASSLKPQASTREAKNGKSSKKSKKRKRDDSTEVKHDIKPGDVERLWKQHVEGDDVSKIQRKEERKKRKLERTRPDRSGHHELPHAMSKPRTERSNEPQKDDMAGTRDAKLGIMKGEKKKHKEKPMDDRPAKEIKRPEASVPSVSNNTTISKPGQTSTIPNVPAASASTSLTPMQSAMRQKLVSARFRHLNQTLYTEPSSKAKELFDQNPKMFEDYHTGFRQQVSVWPENPIDKFILAIRERGKIRPPRQFKPHGRKANSRPMPPLKDDGRALPRTNGICVIADLGCGDARLADTLKVSGDTTTLNLKVLSYDLQGNSKYVTKADISKLPLQDDSVDVAIFCLALMGTNWISFVEEAYRVLHWKGELWVAEIKSRFGRVSQSGKPLNHSVGAQRKHPPSTKGEEAKAKEQEDSEDEAVLQTEVDGVPTTKEETDVAAFVQVLKRRGFILKPTSEKAVDLRNKMFVKMEFVKALTPVKGKGKPDVDARTSSNQKLKFFNTEDENADTDDETKVLKPCMYKTR